MVVRKLEIPPPISSGPQLDSKLFPPAHGGDTPVLECATERQQFSSRLFLLRAAMHACAKRTLYVSLGSRRRSFPVALPRTVLRRRTPAGGDSASSTEEAAGKKGELSGASERNGRCLISARKKDIPRADSSRSVFIPDRCRASTSLIALLSALLPNSCLGACPRRRNIEHNSEVLLEMISDGLETRGARCKGQRL